MDHESEVKCPTCQSLAVLTDVGTASQRKHFKCPSCGAQWREKNPSAVALGSLGGKAAAENMTPEQRTSRARVSGRVGGSVTTQKLSPEERIKRAEKGGTTAAEGFRQRRHFKSSVS